MKNGRYEISGDIWWYKNDLVHREDGPAIEWSSGRKSWFFNGKKHRKNGPALEGVLDYKEWWVNGVQYTKEEFQQWLAKKELNEKLESTLEPKHKDKKKKI